jgi:hypothetical protein
MKILQPTLKDNPPADMSFNLAKSYAELMPKRSVEIWPRKTACNNKLLSFGLPGHVEAVIRPFVV